MARLARPGGSSVLRNAGVTDSDRTDESRPTAAYGAHVSFAVRPGHVEEVVELLRQASATVRARGACHLYVIGRPDDNPDTLSVTELWEDERSHAASLEDERVRALVAQVLPLLAAPPTADVFRVVGGEPASG